VGAAGRILQAAQFRIAGIRQPSHKGIATTRPQTLGGAPVRRSVLGLDSHPLPTTARRGFRVRLAEIPGRIDQDDATPTFQQRLQDCLHEIKCRLAIIGQDLDQRTPGPEAARQAGIQRVESAGQ